FRFNCNGPAGALLALPHGSHLEKLENVEHVRQHAAQNAENWYKYINGTRGRGLVNGSLYLITGCEKSRSGGMASFQNVTTRNAFQLLFKPTAGPDAGYKYRFKRGTPAFTKRFSSSTSTHPLNNTIFLHGFSISIGEGIWARLFGDVSVRQITDSQLQKTGSNFVPFSSQGSISSWSLFGRRGASDGNTYTGRNAEVAVSNFSPTLEVTPIRHSRSSNSNVFYAGPQSL
ncbi:hypothetical protein DFH07DRAFT_762970, partial [Mycena maculata]